MRRAAFCQTAVGALLLRLGAGPVMAQESPRAKQQEASGNAITVSGARARMSEWHEAQTNHLVLLSDAGRSETLRIARNVERLHFLLCGLFGQTYQADDQLRLQVTMIGTLARFEALDLRNRRWQQGPFAEAFRIGRYYDPREDGVVMASTGVDQRIIIERTAATAERVRGLLGGVGGGIGGVGGTDAQQQTQLAVQNAVVGGFATSGLQDAKDLPVTFGENAIELSAESLVYAGYAQHFLLSRFPAAYPRWYLDGFGQVFATFATKGETIMEFGRAPKGSTRVMEAFGPFPVADVLGDKYLTLSERKTAWTPVHAWLLTHFLFFSDKRRPQLRQYLAARAKGGTGAEVFGDLKEFTKELRAYYAARKPYEQITYNPALIDQPTMRQLTEGEAGLITGRLELGGRVSLPELAGAGVPAKQAEAAQKARALAMKEQASWLERVRRDADKYARDANAQLLLAEAECRLGHGAACLAAAKAAQALAPEDWRAQMWQGSALALMATQAQGAERLALVAQGRAMVQAANQKAPEAVGPLLAYYQSYALAGEAPTTNAIDALQAAMELVPASPTSRLALGKVLAGRGQGALARPIVVPVALGPYETPERAGAQDVLRKIAAEGQN